MSRFAGAVRPAAHADVPAITEVYNQAVRDRIATCDLSDVPEDGRHAWLDRHHHPYGVFVAEEGGGVRGWVTLAPYDQKPCFHRTATFSTYVHRDWRGRGVGSALRVFMIDEARRRGFHALVNRVWSNNEASIAFAKRFGFTQVGHMPELVHIDGEYVDCLFFQLLL
ncbi:GNAT family N-acetyltransferase [Micromonospora olivasterospora]|uniref:Phosphinothricin acetyltransferase n=1 Tax=Micromonospora olivasterospora TaxID=1880 RepID=A0A562I2T9_MICOL|nr:GNAT family N-acetyltransferase [Micromonospora olivasterospora]TWH65116.1 phosphinothricin acetyltransferase [Micromonospora olivasterospora]